MPNILITNDDGIHAPGLRALVDALAGLGTLSVVAPLTEQSGKAQSLTLKRPIYVEQLAEREWGVEGTPTDGMILALHRLLPERPDIVVSGINFGGNMGENVYYSGTVGAAMEATINSIPAIAASVAWKKPDVDYSGAAQLTRKLVRLALAEGLPQGVLLNLNVPQTWTGEVRMTRQSRKITRNNLEETRDAQGRAEYWLKEQFVRDDVAPETDFAAIFNGAASLTPLVLDRTHEQSLNHLSHWLATLSKK